MKLKTALTLGRVSNLPTVWSNVLAGLLLAGGTLDAGRVAALILMGSLFYVGGMFLNDVFDAEFDLRERPERPIPAGEVERDEVLRWASAMLLGGLLMAYGLGRPVLLGALVTVSFIVLYNRHHKGNRAAPLLMGSCRVGLYLCGALTVVPSMSGPVIVGAAVLWVYVLGLTHAASHENSSALVRLGPLLGLWAPVLVSAKLLGGAMPGQVLLIGFSLWIIHSLRLVRGRRPASIRRGVVSLIAGIALVDALAITMVAGFGLALVAVAAFLATLALQRAVAGT